MKKKRVRDAIEGGMTPESFWALLASESYIVFDSRILFTVLEGYSASFSVCCGLCHSPSFVYLKLCFHSIYGAVC
ncbi:MAG: hypothetical protein M3O09_01170 [Acidobacteriota bacterium]|nr:hypothetical protein [Acidobacteriota bacterium]